jgi:hypothetical protein
VLGINEDAGMAGKKVPKMEQEAAEILGATAESVERLGAASGLIERTMAWLEERQAAMNGEVQKIVATVEQAGEATRREQELAHRLEEAEREILELKAQASGVGTRKTLTAATGQLLSKQGVGDVSQLEAGALDAALEGLSLEQRIAVKAQLMRSRDN